MDDLPRLIILLDKYIEKNKSSQDLCDVCMRRNCDDEEELIEEIKKLLRLGANINFENRRIRVSDDEDDDEPIDRIPLLFSSEFGNTALQLALVNSSISLNVVKFLVENKASLEKKSLSEMNCLEILLSRYFSDIFYSTEDTYGVIKEWMFDVNYCAKESKWVDSFDKIKYLVNAKINANYFSGQGKSLWAVLCGSEENVAHLINFFLGSKVEPNLCDRKGRNLGHHLIKTDPENLVLLKHVLALKCDVNKKDNKGNTMMHSSGTIKLDTMKLLLNSKGDINIKNGVYRSAYERNFDIGREFNVIKFLISLPRPRGFKMPKEIFLGDSEGDGPKKLARKLTYLMLSGWDFDDIYIGEYYEGSRYLDHAPENFLSYIKSIIITTRNDQLDKWKEYIPEMIKRRIFFLLVSLGVSFGVKMPKIIKRYILYEIIKSYCENKILTF